MLWTSYGLRRGNGLLVDSSQQDDLLPHFHILWQQIFRAESNVGYTHLTCQLRFVSIVSANSAG